MDSPVFTFISYDFVGNSAILRYKIHDEYNETKEELFQETITFPDIAEDIVNTIDAERKKALFNCLKFLHLAAGVSYYKTYIPSKIIIETGDKISQETAEFFNDFYFYGLGEFAYRNKINFEYLRKSINLPFNANFKEEASSIELKDRTVIPLGGGKDSTVTLDALAKAIPNEQLATISVGIAKPIADISRVSGLNHILIRRTISPTLLELNKRKDVYNGHVPITGILAFVLATAAVLYDFKDVAMSNERSASSANITVDDGIEVNHQWSKSFSFEKSINQFFKNNMLKDFEYFSFLRPLSELHIAKLFTQLDSKYHSIFTSCNKAFKLDESQRIEHWCGECDKCRFVFLCLAPFMEKYKLLNIFGGRNLLDDEKQKTGFEELLGLKNYKPFECVGEISECVAAFYQLKQKTDWYNDLLVKTVDIGNDLFNKFGYSDYKDMMSETMQLSDEHIIPYKYKEILDAFTRSAE